MTVRGKWDLAVLVNLDRGVERPGDLIETINRAGCDRHQLESPDRDACGGLSMRDMSGIEEISRLPRVTKYWLLPAGHRLLSALARLDAWFEEGEAAAAAARMRHQRADRGHPARPPAIAKP